MKNLDCNFKKPNKISEDKRNIIVEENQKSTEIRNIFNILRFKIVLTSYNDIIDRNKKYYQINVVSYANPCKPLIIASKPQCNEIPISNFNEAIKIYNNYVESYSTLVKAETSDCQDIENYKDFIGYKITKPNCCLTCKWSKKHNIVNQYIYDTNSDVLECLNPKCVKVYLFDTEHRHAESNPNCQENYHMYKKCTDKHDMSLDLHPRVHIFGLCDNYEK